MTDVINMVLFMAKAAEELPNQTLAFCILCLCLKALLPNVFNNQNPFSNQLALTPYELIARRFSKDVSTLEQIHPAASKAGNDRYYIVGPEIRYETTLKNYMRFWEHGMHVKHDVLDQSEKFNFGIAGLTLLCTTLGQEWAQSNVWKIIQMNCKKSHASLLSDEADLKVGEANELCHAIWAMNGLYSAYVSWKGKIAKQFVKNTVKITKSITETKGSTIKTNISNQAVHALLMNSKSNTDVSARQDLFKTVDDIASERKLPE